MEANTDATLVALRDVTTRLTKNSWRIPRFIGQDQDFFVLGKMFAYRLLDNLADIALFLLHIDQVDRRMRMGKAFVIHNLGDRRQSTSSGLVCVNLEMKV